MKLSRLVNKQTLRNNYPEKNIEQYYLRGIYIPILDTVKTDIAFRLPTDTLEIFDLRLLIPKIIITLIEKNESDKKKLCQ